MQLLDAASACGCSTSRDAARVHDPQGISDAVVQGQARRAGDGRLVTLPDDAEGPTMTTRAAASRCALALCCRRRRRPAQVSFDRILRAERTPEEWLDLLRRHARPAAQPADADHAGQREEPRAAVGVPGALAREVRGHAARRGRRHVHRAGAQRRRRARCGDRARVLGLPVHPVAAGAPVLRPRQSRAGDSRPHALHGDHRRPADRARREDRRRWSGTSRSAARAPRPATR